MNDVPTTRRWYRFSLRTMLVLVTLVCIVTAWIAHNRHVIQERREFLETHQIEVIEAELFPPSIPFPRRLLGDHGRWILNAESQEDLESAKRLFPEAMVRLRK